MVGHWTKDNTIVQGVVSRSDFAILAICDDELLEEKVTHAFIAAWVNGKWLEAGELEWDVVGMDVVDHPKEQVITIGEYGKAWLVASGSRHEETITDGKISPKDRGG